jgi:hypothetical protein
MKPIGDENQRHGKGEKRKGNKKSRKKTNMEMR